MILAHEKQFDLPKSQSSYASKTYSLIQKHVEIKKDLCSMDQLSLFYRKKNNIEMRAVIASSNTTFLNTHC